MSTTYPTVNLNTAGRLDIICRRNDSFQLVLEFNSTIPTSGWKMDVVTKSGGTVVKNVTGYDLSKIITGSYGTLAVISEISLKVLPKPPSIKTLVIHNAQLKKSLEYLGISLSSSSDVSGGVFYPEYFSDQFFLNDLTNKGPITAIRIEGATSSIEKRLEN